MKVIWKEIQKVVKCAKTFASRCRCEILRSNKISRSSVNFSETFFTSTMNSGREIILLLIRCSQEYHFHSFSMTFHDKTRTDTGEGLAQLLWAFFAHTQKGSAPNQALKSLNLWLVNKNAPNFQPLICKAQTNHDSVTRVFPRFTQIPCFNFPFSLALFDIFPNSDWLSWLL